MAYVLHSPISFCAVIGQHNTQSTRLQLNAMWGPNWQAIWNKLFNTIQNTGRHLDAVYIRSGRLTLPSLHIVLEVHTRTGVNWLSFNSGTTRWLHRRWVPAVVPASPCAVP